MLWSYKKCDEKNGSKESVCWRERDRAREIVFVKERVFSEGY